MREYQVRICEGLGVKFPGPTRQFLPPSMTLGGDRTCSDSGRQSATRNARVEAMLAVLTARIFAGARPGDMPFEEPTRYKLVINLKTAKATGVDLPLNFVALADEVIE